MKETLTGSETMGMQAGEILQAIEQKNFESFLKKVGRNSQKTRATYKIGVELLTKFLQKPHADDTIQIIKNFKDPYQLIDTFVGCLTEQGYSNNSILIFIHGVTKWFWYHDVELYREKMKNKIDLPKAEEALDDAPTRQEIRKILSLMEFETQNKMLLLTCSGIRPVDFQFLKWTDFKWDEYPVRLIVPPRGKTRRGWETFITDELTERLKAQKNFRKSVGLWTGSARADNIGEVFRDTVRKIPELAVIGRESKRGTKYHRRKIHVYSLKKFFNSQVKQEVGDIFAYAWEGRKAYLGTYDKLKLEERQKAYIKVMPRFSIFTSEPPKTQDTLRERLKTKGLSDDVIDKVLEGLVLN